MKRYKISVLCGSERSYVEMDLRPTEVKVVERVSALLLAGFEDFEGVPWIDVEEV